MKPVQQLLLSKQQKFGAHPFFGQLEARYPPPNLITFAPRLTFWVMAFQDLLRLNEARMQDALLRQVVARHREEDAGHDKWFLYDMQQLGAPKMDARLLFGYEHQETRDAAYLLMAEVLRIDDDRLRVALLLSLEAAGHVFFQRVSQFVDDKGLSDHLRYFSHYHFRLENGHDLFAGSEEDDFAGIVLPADLRVEAFALAERAFGAFEKMFDGLVMSAHAGAVQGSCARGR